MEIMLAILGAAISASSVIYAIKTNREKHKLERLIQITLAGLAGNIAYVRQNPAWADSHLSDIRDAALVLEKSDSANTILHHAHEAARDCVAAHRMLSNLLGEVLSLQKGLFGTDTVQHPDMSINQASQKAHTDAISET